MNNWITCFHNSSLIGETSPLRDVRLWWWRHPSS